MNKARTRLPVVHRGDPTHTVKQLHRNLISGFVLLVAGMFLAGLFSGGHHVKPTKGAAFVPECERKLYMYAASVEHPNLVAVQAIPSTCESLAQRIDAGEPAPDLAAIDRLEADHTACLAAARSYLGQANCNSSK